ncbi:MAG: hypothetical protein DME01_23970 [Candidatus Rokuibacteriota bacterium]|nr:MAG: hypothetical protein DME01_23970 [Candidatus Rokubacteria bacterium]
MSALLLLAAAVAASAAPPYDGTKPMQCAIQTSMICSDPSVCVRGTADTVGLPAVLNVDVGQRLISGAATGRTIKIAWVSREGGRLLIGGTELGGGWTMSVSEDSGAMSSAVIVRSGGFLVFGSCSSS